MKMKNITFIAAASLLLSMSACVAHREVPSRFTDDINIVMSYYPDLYYKYMKGEIIITDVYKEDTHPKGYGVDYKYVTYLPDTLKTVGGWR